jgi:palmitoyltransferase
MQAVAFTVGLPLTLGLVMLLVWHVQLVLSNKTTIEYQEVREYYGICVRWVL